MSDIQLNRVFGPKWKAKSGREYVVDWCDLCDCAIISCEECGGSTCNGHGCEICLDDDNEFKGNKRHIQDFLTEEEKDVYEKCLRLKKFLLESLSNGEKTINFKEMQKQGKFSRIDEQIFKKELNV